MTGHRIPDDPTRVDTAHGDEVHSRCELFGCTPEHVRDAACAVGQVVESVHQRQSQPTV